MNYKIDTDKTVSGPTVSVQLPNKVVKSDSKTFPGSECVASQKDQRGTNKLFVVRGQLYSRNMFYLSTFWVDLWNSFRRLDRCMSERHESTSRTVGHGHFLSAGEHR